MQTWQMQVAKARLSEVVKRAEREGPQDITMHGKSVAVEISRVAYERLSGDHLSLVQFIRQSPLYGLEKVDFKRGKSVTRETVL